jgi:hypothetical protein
MIRNLSTLLLLGSTLLVGTAAGYETRQVVIVVMDGARLSETFEEEGQPHIPCIWNRLVPRGSYLREFHNNGRTKTNPGHAALLTGTWQPIENDGGEHPTKPTLFEVYRKATGAPAEDVWVVGGKKKLGALAYSTDRSYGSDYGASADGMDDRTDPATYAAFLDILQTHHPALSLLSLSATDIHGHDEDREGYLESIQRVDSLLCDLWGRLQADTAYAGRTTLFFTYDHGRHLDSEGGFEDHGDSCAGCVRLGFLALGPDFKNGFASSRPREMIDVAPTVAELLGLSLPESTGEVMTEILAKEPPSGKGR